MNRKEHYATTYRTLFHSEVPAGVSWETSQADILSEGRGFIRAFDFTLQLQVGCPGGCLFCYVPDICQHAGRLYQICAGKLSGTA